jgi:hypothetical protein
MEAILLLVTFLLLGAVAEVVVTMTMELQEDLEAVAVLEVLVGDLDNRFKDLMVVLQAQLLQAAAAVELEDLVVLVCLILLA